MNRSRLLLLCAVLLWTAPASHAQSPADSAALTDAVWKTWQSEEGLTCKSLQIDLFDSPQNIYCLEIDTARYRLEIAQDSVRRTPGFLGRRSGAQAAINGGFFVTKTNEAIANDFIKVGGEVLPSAGGWGNAGIGITPKGEIAFINWAPSMQDDTLWHSSYADILMAGPMLLLDNQTIPNSDPTRHPRSVIGQKNDGTVVLMVVDGRRKKAAGVSFAELAFMARILGMRSALNLDGGGSSALWVDGNGNLNRPSDRLLFIRLPRDVANAVLVHRK